MRQQCGADASGPPASYEPGSARSQAFVLELSRLARGEAQRAESLRSARVALAQLRLVATPPDGSRRVRAKIVNSTRWGLRRSPNGYGAKLSKNPASMDLSGQSDMCINGSAAKRALRMPILRKTNAEGVAYASSASSIFD